MNQSRSASSILVTRSYGRRHRGVAALYGLLCHLAFAVGIAAMALGLYSGMAYGLGSFTGWRGVAMNALLVAQFPILHSLLLTRRGRRLMSQLAPAGLGGPLSTTTFAAIASLQVLVVFAAWNPSGIVWWQPRGVRAIPWAIAFGLSWLLLLKAMWDAGLGVQTGFHGWGAVVRGVEPEKIAFRQTGSFRYVRQPVYVAFALTLWTGPVWSPDHLAIAVAWTAYCLLGPVLKEKRYLEFYGESFRDYRRSVPYWLPLQLPTRRNLTP